MSLSDTDEPGDGMLSPRKERMVAKEKEAISRLLLKSQGIPPVSGKKGSPQTSALLASLSTADDKRQKHSAGFDDIRAALSRLQQSAKQAAQMRKIDKTRTYMSKDGNMMKALSEEIEQAYATLSQREEDIRLATQLGSHLLYKVDESIDSICKLEDRIREQDEQLEKAKEDKRQLERQEKRHLVAIEELEQQLSDANKQLKHTRSVLERLKEEKGAQDDELITSLETQIRELQEQNANLSADQAKLVKELKQERETNDNLLKDLDDYREKMKQFEALQSTVGNLRKKLAGYEQMRARNEELEWEHKHILMQLRELTEENERLNNDNFQKDSDLLQLSQSQESTPHSSRSGGVERSPSIAEELGLTPPAAPSSKSPDSKPSPVKKGLFGFLRSKKVPDVKEEDTLSENSQGDSHNRRRSSTIAYGTTGDESFDSGMFCEDSEEKGGMGPGRVYGTGRAGGSQDPLSGSGGGSEIVSGDREAVSSHPLVDDAGRPMNSVDEYGRRFHDANKEFFCLTALAIKLNTGDILDSVSTVSNKQMYQKALEQKVPFHKYAAFIEREITHAYIERVYNPDQFASNERTDPETRLRNASKTGHGRAGSMAAADMCAAGQALTKSKSAQGNYKPRIVPARKSTVSSSASAH